MDLYRSGVSAENRSFSLCSWLGKIEVFHDHKSSGGDQGLQLLNLSVDAPFRMQWRHEEKGVV